MPASPLVARLARAALWAGKASRGLVDATLAGEIEAAGYAASRSGLAPAPLADALAAAPPRVLARPRPEPGFARIEVLADGRVVRPPSVRLDSGGSARASPPTSPRSWSPRACATRSRPAAISPSAAASGRSP